ncbi:MAG TPA: YjbQ family protein [Thermoplasmatales archaeon]|nr:YjbQ family protein [Thermoplasmatales archaeon]
MKVVTDFIEIESIKIHEYIDITSKVNRIVEESRIKNGIVCVHEMHTTGAIVIQENDSDMHEDTKEILNELIPPKKSYRHSYEGNENATAHIKNQFLGSGATIPVINGKLALGTWQRIFFIELFRARHRKIAVSILGE